MFRLILTLSFFWLNACASSSILRDKDYQHSLSAAKAGDFEKAQEEFPKKEAGGFITSVEKAWLGYWTAQSKEEFEDLNLNLQRQIQTFEDRKFLSFTRESKNFFYQETEDGYIPSEHEAVILHLLSAQIFLQLEKNVEAEVEVRRATYLLQGLFNENQPHFDDPALRLWLAALWSGLGQWNEARVDFRKAAELSGDKNLLRLSNQSEIPKKLVFTFRGLSPDLDWSENDWQPRFVQPLGSLVQSTYSFSTLPWFERHHERNSSLRDTLLKSNYMTQFLGTKASSTAKYAATGVAVSSVKVAGVVLGGAIIGLGLYALVQSPGASEGAAYILMFGAGVVGSLWKVGDDLFNDMTKSIGEDETRDLEGLRTYRFVRFLPAQISMEVDPGPNTPTRGYKQLNPQGKGHSPEVWLRRVD